MTELQTILQAIPIIFITSAVQLFKMLGMPTKYSPIAAFGLAIFFACFFLWNADATKTIVTIFMYGLSAVGLWEVGGKKILPDETTLPPKPPVVSEN